MRTLLIVFLVVFSFSGIRAQFAVVFPYQHNVLMKGIPNELVVGLPGIRADSIQLRTENGSLEKINTWQWRITPDTISKSAAIVVEAWLHDTLVLMDTMLFRLQWLPDPKIYVANKTGSTDSIPRLMLLDAAGVFARGENIDQDFPYRVLSFRMTIETGKSWRTYTGNDPGINAEMRRAIQDAHSGDKAVFDNVMVRYPDGRIKEVNGVTLLLK